MKIGRAAVATLTAAGLASSAGPLFAQASSPSPGRRPAGHAVSAGRAAPDTRAASSSEGTPRGDLERLRATLEAALVRPRPLGFSAIAPPGQIYRLKGYGAVIVLAPRRLAVAHVFVRRVPAPPSVSPPQVTIDLPEDVNAPMDLAQFERELERQMAAQAEALREMESVQREWTRASEDEMRRSLRLVEQQAEVFRQEADRARQEAERDVRIRLAPVPPVEVPEAPETPVAPEAPEAPPPPPWLFWFDAGRDAAAPEPPDGPPARDLTAMIGEAREQLAAALASYARPISGLGADESVTVAVDFVADPPRRRGPGRTLLVRVRAGDLRDRQAGRLSAADLRSRLEFDEQDD